MIRIVLKAQNPNYPDPNDMVVHSQFANTEAQAQNFQEHLMTIMVKEAWIV